jgi:hypothetical protein
METKMNMFLDSLDLKNLTRIGLFIVALATVLAFTLDKIYISQLVGMPGILIVLLCSYKSHYKNNQNQSSNYKYLIVFVVLLQLLLAASLINKHLL